MTKNIKSNHIYGDKIKENNTKYIVWDKDIKNCYMTIPKEKTLLFGRHIYDMNDNIICRDFPQGYVAKQRPEKYILKCPIIENGSIIRFFNFNDIWYTATSNRINAKNNVYKCNKNINIKYNTCSFYNLFKSGIKNFDIKTLDKDYTYMYNIVSTKIFISSKVDKTSITLLARYNNKTGFIDMVDKTKTDNIGYYYIDEYQTYIIRTKQFSKRLRFMSKYTNVYYIILKNITNIKQNEFCKKCPYWKQEQKKILIHLKYQAGIILQIYNTIHKNDDKLRDIRIKKYLKLKEIEYKQYSPIEVYRYRLQKYNIFVNYIHELYVETKHKITKDYIFEQILLLPAFTITGIVVNANI